MAQIKSDRIRANPHPITFPLLRRTSGLRIPLVQKRDFDTEALKRCELTGMKPTPQVIEHLKRFNADYRPGCKYAATNEELAGTQAVIKSMRRSS